jgi:Pao retrotransposon peptidase
MSPEARMGRHPARSGNPAMGEVGRRFVSYGISHHPKMYAAFVSDVHLAPPPPSSMQAKQDTELCHTYCSEAKENFTASFVMSKCRVAPIHHLTIPRMELSAALLGVRLAKMIKQELRLRIDDETYWSDSSTVLRWIYSTHCRYHTWVANRVGEILTLTDAKQWRHVPGVLNPADDCSRGVEAASLAEDNRWWTGPTFLRQSTGSWPAMPEYLSSQTTTPR